MWRCNPALESALQGIEQGLFCRALQPVVSIETILGSCRRAPLGRWPSQAKASRWFLGPESVAAAWSLWSSPCLGGCLGSERRPACDVLVVEDFGIVNR
jgi:hypothetical protein